MIRAGQLRHRIDVQNRSVTLDSFGGQPLTWTTFATVWADVLPMSAREREASQAINVEVSHEITVRYRSDFADPKVMASRRIVYRGRYFNIQGIGNVDERNREMTIWAQEGMNLG